MPADPLTDPGRTLREAAARPRQPVDAGRVLARGEHLRRRRAGLRAAAAALLLVPIAAVAIVLVRPAPLELGAGDPYDGDIVPASLAASEQAPDTLADGAPAGPVPDAVTRRFAEPVRATERLRELPEDLEQVCRPRGPLAAERGPALPSVWQVQDQAADDWVGHVGPHVATTIAALQATTPPGYPDRVSLTCVATHVSEQIGSTRSGEWQSEGLAAEHLFPGWTGISRFHGGDAASVTWVTALPVPSGAAWAVQEHPGWWLAYDVAGAPWLLAHTSRRAPADPADLDDVGFPGARVVFLDADGRVLGEERKGTDAIGADAPFFSSQATDAVIDLGDVDTLREDLGDGPVLVCADDTAVCAWVVDVDGELHAHAAAGPHPRDTPPFGFVAWCADPAYEGRLVFEGTTTSSVFDAGGAYVAGDAPSGLNGYDVVVDGGQAHVDLSAFRFGEVRETAISHDMAPCSDLRADPERRMR